MFPRRFFAGVFYPPAYFGGAGADAAAGPGGFFGHSYFGASYYGPHYFSPAAAAGPAAPAVPHGLHFFSTMGRLKAF